MRWSPYICVLVFLLLCQAGNPARAALAAKPRRARAVAAGRTLTPAPAITIEHLTTHASYALRPDRRPIGFSTSVMRSMSQLLRCHHTGKRHAINSRVIEIVYAAARHFHSAKVYIIAGYRAPSIAREKGNPNSPHKRGVACDFRLEDVSIEALRDYLRSTYHNIGVGYYPNSGFIHVDVGRRKEAFWIDYSAPGQKARYGVAAPLKSADGNRTEETVVRPSEG